MPNKLLNNVADTLILVKKLDLEFKMCPPTFASGSSEACGEVLDAQTVIKFYQNIAQCIRNKLRP